MHSIALPIHLSKSSWTLQPFQKSNLALNKAGEHFTFISHLEMADAHLQRPSAIVVISGGHTNSDVAHSEAETYLAAARALGLSGFLKAPERCLTEDYACDSFQNLLFSILTFRRRTGTYPVQITVITHAFKTRRFMSRHAPAIDWPLDRIVVDGRDPPWADHDERDKVMQLEMQNAVKPFTKDPYGGSGPLASKRLYRGWDEQTISILVEDLEDSVEKLVRWNGPDKFAAILPWSDKA